MLKIILIILLYLLLVIPGCSPESSDYVSPQIYIDTLVSNVKNNGMLFSDTAVIAWLGNSESCEFRTQMDNLSWTVWEQDYTLYKGYLNDGSHVFRIEARYKNETKTSSLILSFVVNCLKVFIDTVKTNVKENEILLSDSVAIFWKANTALCEYRHQLNEQSWTGWKKDDTLFICHLDDRTHTFRVQAHHKSDTNAVASDSLSFLISALVTPAVYVSPREQTILSDTAQISIKTKGIANSYSIHLMFSGATVFNAIKVHGVNDANVNILHDASSVDMVILPGAAPVIGDCEVMKISIINIDSINGFLDITECVVIDSCNNSVNVSTVRGGFLNKSDYLHSFIPTCK